MPDYGYSTSTYGTANCHGTYVDIRPYNGVVPTLVSLATAKFPAGNMTVRDLMVVVRDTALALREVDVNEAIRRLINSGIMSKTLGAGTWDGRQ